MIDQAIDKCNDDRESKYKKGEVIGVGGFGLVYEAYDQTKDEKVVIKVLKRKSKEETFKREINIMKQIHHPSVVTLLDTFHTKDNIFCAVMNFAENGSILSDLMRNGPYNEDKMKTYMKSILEGLDSIHRQGIIHNDIKAANILINKGKALIADFGASIDTKETKNCKSSIGSPHWMSPETASGRSLTTKSDIWSIGILAIEMLTGKPPLSNFPGSTVLLILKETKRVPISLKVSDICLSFIKMCLQSNPKYRPDASDLLYHPFFMENSNVINGLQNPSFLINLANQITIEQQSCPQIVSENQDKIISSLKKSDEINDCFIFLETIALFSKEDDIHFICPIIEFLMKLDMDQISSNEIVKIILLFLRNFKEKCHLFMERFNIIGFLAEKESVKENPLNYIVQEHLKIDGIEIVNINEIISFLAQYRYDRIYNKLTNVYRFSQIPRRLRLLLNEKMHEINSESFSAALRMINDSQLGESQIKSFCHFFDIAISNNLKKEDILIIINILEKSPLDTLGFHQQNTISSFVLSCCINQSICKLRNDEMQNEIIEKTVIILEKLTKVNISNALKQKSEFWKVLYRNHLLKIISIFANKYPEEFEANISIELTLKMIIHSIESRQYADFELYEGMFKNSSKLCLSFVFDSIFTEFSKVLCQVSSVYRNNCLKIIQELIKVPKKPDNFYVCLKGPLTKLSIFNQDQYAEIILKLLNAEQMKIIGKE